MYFLSDLHLRTDHPRIGRRFAAWLDRLRPGLDPLYVVGDLCDFWFASRQRRGLELPCDGLRALAGFAGRGGEVTILPGNHDAWLGDYYRDALGARYVEEGRIELRSGSLRILATHGHQLGARNPWKHVMEARAFLKTFRALPDPVATRLATLLDRNNEARLEVRHRKYLELYRRQVLGMAGAYDLVILGHIHQAADFADAHPRLIVLGPWKDRTSFLEVEGERIAFVIED